MASWLVRASEHGAALAVLCLILLGGARPGQALEFFDGRLEVHGYYEQQIRSIWTDFTGSNDWDLTQ